MIIFVLISKYNAQIHEHGTRLKNNLDQFTWDTLQAEVLNKMQTKKMTSKQSLIQKFDSLSGHATFIQNIRTSSSTFDNVLI